ncbi:MAG: right-handed parallel beta-helix repeat-containing protein, partial [Planctomycetota bacterium]
MRKAVLILSWLLLAIPCQAEIIIVDDGGYGDFDNIQAAIDDSNDGDIIYVFPGTYTGSDNRDIDYGGRAITVTSVAPEDPYIVAITVIDCEGAGRGFYFQNGEDANSILDGLTITNGYADFGGAIRCSSSPTISNCIIKDNTATAEGGGVYGCSGSITKCTITGNSAVQDGGGLAECYRVSNCSISNNSALRGGGIWCNEFDPILTGCEFSWNSASNGGGLSCMYGSNPTLANCAFVQNSGTNRGGGIYNHEAYAASITSCIFIGNSAAIAGGGMYDEYGGGKLTSCVFSGNTASDGGGIYHYYSGLPISNCTFSGNSAVSAGGGIYGDPDVDNCILWGNRDSSGTGESAQISDPASVTFSCIQDEDPNDANIPFGGEGNNNIDDNPIFVRDANDGGDGWGDDPCTPGVDEGANDDFGDLHLQSGSPCINAGDPFINACEPFNAG